MTSKKIKNLGLKFEKITISKLKQTVVKGGANAIEIDEEASSKVKSCFCTYCDFHDC